MLTPTNELAQTLVTNHDCLPGYELLSIIGSGGFGTVYKAMQIKLDRLVAVKVIRNDEESPPQSSARFDREKSKHGKLQHPHIVQVYDSGRSDDRMYLVMELLEGEDLSRRLHRDGPLSEAVVWAIARQTVSALAYAASLGIIHRDIKPENLFLVPAPLGSTLPTNVPHVKVTDFGLAISKGDRNLVWDRLTQDGITVGTPMYMAPEQHRHEPELDHRADIYSLGATIAHALSAQPPFVGRSIWELMEQKLKNAVLLPHLITPESAELLRSMVDVNPEKRPANYSELIARIDRLPAMKWPTILKVETIEIHRAFSRLFHNRRIVIAAIFLICLVVGLSVTGSAWPGLFHRNTGDFRFDQQSAYETTSEHRLLFDGESLEGWLYASSSGYNWQTDVDDERDPVLTGVGVVRRSLGAVKDYRLTFGLDVYKSTETEIHFGIPSKNPERANRLVIRISRKDGAVLGMKNGDKEVFKAVSKPVPFPSNTWFEGRRPYLEVRVEKMGEFWAAWFCGKQVGTYIAIHETTSPEFRIFANEGPIRIDSVILTPFTRKELAK